MRVTLHLTQLFYVEDDVVLVVVGLVDVEEVGVIDVVVVVVVVLVLLLVVVILLTTAHHHRRTDRPKN